MKAAIEFFLNTIHEPESPGLLSEAEFKRIYWPNFPDRFVYGAGMSPDNAWTMAQVDIAVALPHLKTMMTGGPVRVRRISGGRPAEQYHAIRANFPGEIELERMSDGARFTTDLILVVIEHRGQFKVARIGPD